MGSRERILQFIEYKGLSKNKFYKETGLSNGFLDKNINVGVDKIEIICSKFPEINVEWLVLGNGEMIKNDTGLGIASEPPAEYSKSSKDLIGAKDKVIEILERENSELRTDKEFLRDLVKSKIITP